MHDITSIRKFFKKIIIIACEFFYREELAACGAFVTIVSRTHKSSCPPSLNIQLSVTLYIYVCVYVCARVGVSAYARVGLRATEELGHFLCQVFPFSATNALSLPFDSFPAANLKSPYVWASILDCYQPILKLWPNPLQI